LFERFYRVPSSSTTRGTGLGLYISRKIIEAHGGEIGVESTIGEGTTFYFDLPITELSEEEAGGRI
jgi:signal transduction histidine kinase